MSEIQTHEIEARRAALEERQGSWKPCTLGALLARSAEAFGDRPFVITDDRTLTYAETDAWASRLADGLAALGVAPGDRVGIVMANYLEFVPLKFAVARAGAVAIPFNYLYRQDELAYVLAQSDCNVLVTMTGFGGLDYPAMLDAIAPGWEGGPTKELPSLRQVIAFENEGPARDGQLTLEALDRLGIENPNSADDSVVTPDSLGDILYTSGTTGSPKGVMVTHDGIQRTGYSSAYHRAFEDGRRVLFSLPCYHMFGLVEGLLAVMFVGGAIIPRTAFSPADYFAGIEAHGAHDILAVPTMTIALLEHPDRKTRDLSTLRAILSGAAPAPTWVWDRARTELGITEVTTGYGMTECGGATTLTLPEDPIEMHVETVGVAKLAGVASVGYDGRHCEYRTADPTTGEHLEAGTEGELISRGPSHMMGFWGKPEETELALRDGWVYSGDLGRVRDDGYLQLTGRTKELYKSGGELVMPIEIEALVTKHPAISQAYAVGVPDDRWGEVGWLYVTADADATDVDQAAVIAELEQQCRDNLARFKVPKRILFADAAGLPMTPTGKVQKFRLVERAVKELAQDG